MKTSKLLASATFVVAFGLGSVSYANDQPLLSPKAQSQIPTVGSGTSKNDPGLAQPSLDKVALSPKAASMVTMVVAGSSKSDPDLAHTYSTLSPRGQAMLGESAKRFEVAPVK
jgi:hypothetical protein